MSASQPTCGRHCWVQTVLILLCLAVMAWWTLGGRIVPDADDCAARGEAADCWRGDTTAPVGRIRFKRVYDERGEVVPP